MDVGSVVRGKPQLNIVAKGASKGEKPPVFWCLFEWHTGQTAQIPSIIAAR